MNNLREGSYLIKILVLIMFLVPTIINYKHKRENILEVKKKSKEMIGVVALLIVGSFICYKFDNTIIGYLVSLAATMMLYTSVFFQGFTEKGINIFLGTSPILKFVELSKITKLEMERNKYGEIELKIHAYGNENKQSYRGEDEYKIVRLVNSWIDCKINSKN